MFLRLIKMNLNLEEQCLGIYDNFVSLNTYLDQIMIESDEYLILEVCDAQGVIYFEEKINAYGGLSNKEQTEIKEALERIEKQKEMPTLDISFYNEQLKIFGCEAILPNFEDEDAQLIIHSQSDYEVPTGFMMQNHQIICELIGDDALERQTDFEEQIQLLIDYLKTI